MRGSKSIRVIKRDERSDAVKTTAEHKPNPAEGVRILVSGWVRERQQRSEEFRHNYTNMLKEFGFRLPRASTRG